jgi:tetratricopeptide (TPR) repeat protein
MSVSSARQVSVVMAALWVAGTSEGAELNDLHFGETLYHAYQEHYFDALQRLDAEIAQHYGVDEPERDSLQPHIDHAEFSVGDFELRYRMHHRAGRAIRAVLEGDVEEPVRNDAAFRLARIHFQKDQPYAALQALERISGRVPEDIRDDVEFLRANIYMAIDRAPDAVDVLERMEPSGDLKGFAAYNLGIALLRDGREQEAIAQLDRSGQMKSVDPATRAIRDKSNLVLGTLLFESSQFGPSQHSLDRVRLEGPFSNQALLRAGWADVSAEKFDRAVVPWSILAERDPTDAAVQEALLALPYAYGVLNVHGRAALLYGKAVDAFGSELGKVDASIHSIRDGDFLEALVREEIRQDKDWVIRLRSLPDAPETFYLMALMATHDFQTSLQNYLDLEDMRKKLLAWQRSFDAFDDIVALRRSYYEPLLPEIDAQFRTLDARIRLRVEQREHLQTRLDHLLISPRPEHLATGDERMAESRIDVLEAALGDAVGSEADNLRLRIRRLRGVLGWTLETEYHQCLTDAHEHLAELNEHLGAMTTQYDAFVRTRQVATHSYDGYTTPIGILRMRVAGVLERLNVLMGRQGQVLETVAVKELQVRRERLENYQHQARFALADSYDRAAQARVQ